MSVLHRSSLSRAIIRASLLAAALVLGLGALGAPAAEAQPARDIVDTVQAAGHLDTLARALQAAGLVDTLKGPGPFTVFAPTDAAFNRLPAGTLDQLLQNRDQLRAVLTYHAVQGRVMAADLAGHPSAPSVRGAALNFSLNPPRVNDANITQADVMASNGVIHVVDNVLLPPGLMQPGALPRAGLADTATTPVTVAVVGLTALAIGGLFLARRPAPARSRDR